MKFYQHKSPDGQNLRSEVPQYSRNPVSGLGLRKDLRETLRGGAAGVSTAVAVAAADQDAETLSTMPSKQRAEEFLKQIESRANLIIENPAFREEMSVAVMNLCFKYKDDRAKLEIFLTKQLNEFGKNISGAKGTREEISAKVGTEAITLRNNLASHYTEEKDNTRSTYTGPAGRLEIRPPNLPGSGGPSGGIQINSNMDPTQVQAAVKDIADKVKVVAGDTQRRLKEAGLGNLNVPPPNIDVLVRNGAITTPAGLQQLSAAYAEWEQSSYKVMATYINLMQSNKGNQDVQSKLGLLQGLMTAKLDSDFIRAVDQTVERETNQNGNQNALVSFRNQMREYRLDSAYLNLLRRANVTDSQIAAAVGTYSERAARTGSPQMTRDEIDEIRTKRITYKVGKVFDDPFAMLDGLDQTLRKGERVGRGILGIISIAQRIGAKF